MTKFSDRPAFQQELIKRAYDFEMKAIKDCSPNPNPYGRLIKDAFQDGADVWEAINIAVELAF